MIRVRNDSIKSMIPQHENLFLVLLSRLPTVKGPSFSPQEAADKKRESRKSGFFNLIKSRTSRSEKSHGTASLAPPQPASSTSASPAPAITAVTEETTPTSPATPAGSSGAAAEPHQELRRAHSSDHTDSEMETPSASAEPEVAKEETRVGTKEIPHIPRHIGVPVMGMDLLAEMKARQERMAVKKVSGAHGSNLLKAFETIITPVSLLPITCDAKLRTCSKMK